ncbi:MAG: uridine kinase family protein [Chitinophagales bacterium]
MSFIQEIKALASPTIVAISGYGGSGKSTLAKHLAKELNTNIVCIDSFAKDSQLKSYNYWNVMDFQRMEREVILPFLAKKETITYGDFNWENNQIDKHVTINNTQLLIIEGVGLFRPELIDYFSYKIWVDTSLEKSIAQGKKRDKEQYNKSLDEYWDGVWRKNDIECFEKYQPLAIADCIY